jgi:hypothetical protein
VTYQDAKSALELGLKVEAEKAGGRIDPPSVQISISYTYQF